MLEKYLNVNCSSSPSAQIYAKKSKLLKTQQVTLVSLNFYLNTASHADLILKRA